MLDITAGNSAVEIYKKQGSKVQSQSKGQRLEAQFYIAPHYQMTLDIYQSAAANRDP